MSQTSLICLAFLCLAWWSSEAHRPVLCGVFTALASFKPSLGVFVYIALLLRRDWRMMVALIVTCLALAARPLWDQGPVALVGSWLSMIRLYGQYPENQPSWPQFFGLKKLLFDLGMGYRFVPLLGVVGFGWSLWRLRFIRPLEMFALCLAWPVLFIQAHNYDVVVLHPLYVAVLIAIRRSYLALGGTAALVGLIAWDESGVFSRRLYPGVSLYPHGTIIVSLAFLVALVIMIEWRAHGEMRRSAGC